MSATQLDSQNQNYCFFFFCLGNGLIKQHCKNIGEIKKKRISTEVDMVFSIL